MCERYRSVDWFRFTCVSHWFPFSEKRRLRGDLVPLYSFLRRGSGEGGADLFSLVSTDRTHGNGLELHQGRFRFDMRKHFFTERVVKHWNRIPREVISAPSLSAASSPDMPVSDEELGATCCRCCSSALPKLATAWISALPYG
ncbi:hypothetical protein QYF61_000090, partial [Mycteria americana]